ncbi:MAG: DUF4147 domain-containing protein [Candidatus Doudnabacteria bacterium]
MESHTIKNYDKLATSKLRQDILAMGEAGLTAIDTAKVIEAQIQLKGRTLTIRNKSFDLDKFKNIKVIGFGKASCKAAEALEKKLGKLIESGVAIGLTATACEIIKTYGGTHPEPSYHNVDISRQIFEIGKTATADDLVIVIVSGGGSSLLCWPKTECDQGQILYHQFLKTGGTIKELNTVRKHISLLKGGGLAKILYPATVIGLIFSDIPGDHFDMVASGPTYKDSSTVKDAEAIIDKYNLTKFDLVETPKDDKYFANVSNIHLVDNIQALEGIKKCAQDLGYNPVVLSNEVYEQAPVVVKKMRDLLDNYDLILAGGEPAMKVAEGGNGGRNLYVAMIALDLIGPDECFLALASDGMDNSDAAGAVVDAKTKKTLNDLKINLADSIAKFNGYKLFEQLGELVFTGPTEANVSDLFILVKNKL